MLPGFAITHAATATSEDGLLRTSQPYTCTSTRKIVNQFTRPQLRATRITCRCCLTHSRQKSLQCRVLSNPSATVDDVTLPRRLNLQTDWTFAALAGMCSEASRQTKHAHVVVCTTMCAVMGMEARHNAKRSVSASILQVTRRMNGKDFKKVFP